MVLHPPVDPMLAQASDQLPPPRMLGDLSFQPKFDGYRGLIFTASAAVDSVQIQSRRGALLQSRFPDLVRAAAALPDGLVLDGELVVWDENRMSFEAVQRRAAAGSRSATQLAVQLPAHFIAFDLLQVDGEELLTTRYGERRDLLASLFAEQEIGPPWTLCPETEDVRVAQEWLSTWTDVPGVEGVVVRDRRQRYVPGSRGWYKIRRRDTTEAVVGAVTGTLEHPQTLVLGRYDEKGVLRAVARSTVLHPDQARRIGAQLTLARPGHAWEGVRFTTSWRSHTPLDVTLVEPEQVAEMSVDTAQAGGVWRHPVRVVRLRADMTPAEVPTVNSSITVR
ncbi:ATP-dependent DNA ligase [Streptomyces sp. NPDC090023]|uniref:ATP-dependent DNA ligase n=1 Tax=unclassified Streptomyces TaxID=2593676 RepID=UPI003814E965